MQRLHAVVYGRVQGVGFRASTVSRANGLGLTGWVRNRADGTVEVMAEGERSRLDALLNFLEEGPLVAHVTSVNADWQEATGEFASFEIA